MDKRKAPRLAERGAQEYSQWPLIHTENRQRSGPFQATAAPTLSARHLRLAKRRTRSALTALSAILHGGRTRSEVFLTFPAHEHTHTEVIVGPGYCDVATLGCVAGPGFRCAACERAAAVGAQEFFVASLVLDKLLSPPSNTVPPRAAVQRKTPSLLRARGVK